MKRKVVRKQAGFTLLELVIAMVAGLLTIAGAYYIGSLSAHSFHGQMRTSEMQGTLRAAMEQLAREIPRAGFLATADSDTLPDCKGGFGGTGETGVVPTTRLLGVSVSPFQSDVKAALGDPTTNRTRADSLTLLGNYETGEVYAVASDNLGDNTVLLESTREGFRRSFFVPTAGALVGGTFSLARFQEVFAVGRLVRVDTNNRVFFRTITAATADKDTGANATVEFTPALPSACFSRATALITPISMIRYRFEPVLASDARFKRLAPKTDYPGSSRVALVRSELDPTDPTKERENSSRVVLDYAVEFQVDGVIENAGGSPKFAVRTDTTSPSVYDTNPTILRALRVTLSTRTEDLDPRWTPPAMRTSLSDPLLSFGLNVDGRVLHARVRTLRQEFVLPNL